VLTDGTTQLGSIAAGGRYDELVGMFTTAGQKIPCVGVSIGVERVFTMMEKRMADAGAKASCSIQVYVACIGENTMIHRMRVAKMLWAANIAAEYSHHESPRLKKQLDEVLSRGVPFMLVMGEDEIKNGTVKVKNVQEHSETEVSLDGLVPYLRSCGL
jgi:histidyl-tRNA synthetase